MVKSSHGVVCKLLKLKKLKKLKKPRARMGLDDLIWDVGHNGLSWEVIAILSCQHILQCNSLSLSNLSKERLVRYEQWPPSHNGYSVGFWMALPVNMTLQAGMTPPNRQVNEGFVRLRTRIQVLTELKECLDDNEDDNRLKEEIDRRIEEAGAEQQDIRDQIARAAAEEEHRDFE